MQAQDDRFFEEFKRLEQLCSDMFACQSGVSAYIAEMEDRAAAGRARVSTWNDDLKGLKHVRWVRNQLAHGTGTERLSGAEDLAFVKDFRRRILSGQDPLAQLGKGKKQATAGKAQATNGKAQATAGKAQAKTSRDRRGSRGRKRRSGPLLILLVLVLLALLLLFLFTRYGGTLPAALRPLFPGAGG